MDDHLTDFHELLLSEFPMVAPEKVDTFVSQFSRYIDVKVDTAVRNAQRAVLQSITDPERGQPHLHQAIMERPLSGRVKSFAQFNADTQT